MRTWTKKAPSSKTATGLFSKKPKQAKSLPRIQKRLAFSHMLMTTIEQKWGSPDLHRNRCQCWAARHCALTY